MKHFFSAVLGLVVPSGLLAQSPSFISAWHPAGQPSGSEAVAVATDAAGNVYTVGHFMGSGDFDPGPGVVTLSSASAGTYDVFVTKMDAAGQLVWARRFGGPGHEWATAVVVDDQGGVITCGRYNGIADMDPGPATVNLDINGGEDIFVQKLDSDGLFVMAQRYGSGGFDAPYAMTQGPDGMIYLVGTFTGNQVPFGGYLLSTTPEFGIFDNYDGFIMKMDAEGAVYWAHRIGGNTYLDRVHDVAIDPVGNILFVGTFSTEEADFGPNAVDFGPDPVGLLDAFVCKWNANAGLQWLVQIGGQGDDVALAVTTDADGNCYVTGTYDAACHMNVGGPGQTLSTAGGRDIFVAQYDPEGNPGWTKSIGGTGAEDVTDIALTAADQVVVSGSFSSVVDMDPGTGTVSRTSAGGADLFLLGLGSEGDYAWDISLGSSVADLARGLHGSVTGDLFAAGLHGGDIDFDPGPGTLVLPASGARAWAMRLGVCAPLDTGVSLDGATLTAQQNGAAYQWIDCGNGNAPIIGATGQVFTPEENGDYAVEVTIEDCTALSECVQVLSTGTVPQEGEGMAVFPVPAADHVFITGIMAGSTIVVLDAQARVVRSMRSEADRTRMDLRGLDGGAYIVRAHEARGVRTARIVVK